MEIDWFTLIAQIINFLILVFLLKHFLYGPITRAMQEREKKIANRLEEAEKERNKAEEEARSYQQKTRELDEKREKILSQARDEAGETKNRMIQEGRREVDEIKAKWLRAINREKESFLKDLRRRATAQIFHAVRAALKDLADQDLEQFIIRVFDKRLKNLDDEKRKIILEKITEENGHVDITSSFELPDKWRTRITDTIKDTFTSKIQADFKTSDDLVCGIELKVKGGKIAWNMANYLQDLERKLFQSLEQRTTQNEENTEKEEESGEDNNQT